MDHPPVNIRPMNNPQPMRPAAGFNFRFVFAGLLLPFLAATTHAQPEKGPVGWDVYRHLERLPELTSGVSTRMFSSFDRSGGNNDGFQGTYSCLRENAFGCVIAEHRGAGEIQSIWFTRSGGNVSETGAIRIELDGNVVLEEPLQALVNGAAGAPFTFPLVANADQSSGGVTAKVPMPYRESMRISVESNPLFYHVTYRTFSDSDGVETFDPSDAATDVVELLRSYGRQSPLPGADEATVERRSFQLPAGESAVLAEVGGSGQIVELELHLPQLVRSYGPLRDDGRAHQGFSEFTARLDGQNDGARLTRRLAAGIGMQTASVEVDGDSVALWSPLPASPGRWIEQRVELPASATAGKSEVTIVNRFVSSNLDFNEFTYFVESNIDGEYVPTDTIDVGPESQESEQAHAYRIVGQNWQGVRNFFHTLEEIEARTPRVLPTDSLLEGLRLQIDFDGRRTVDAPIGEFFGTGLGEYDVRSLFFAVDDVADRFTAWWPMPFAEQARVRLANTSEVDLEESSITVSHVPDASIADKLEAGRFGYFHATARLGEPEPDRDWIFLDQMGFGKIVGVSHTMFGDRHTGNIRAYLEGDLRVYVDESRTPQLYGTGTEDFYEGGWYFNRNAFHLPFHGNTAHEDFLGGVWGVRSGDAPADTDGTLGCRYSCDSAYRLLIGDAVPFGRAVRAGMEHGPHNEFPATYSSTTFWYGHADHPVLMKTDSIDVNDARYQGGENPAPQTFISTFEGDFNNRTVIEEMQEARGPVEFRVRLGLKERATPVLLRRLSNQAEGYQQARVFVDGEEAGVWLQPLGNETHRGLEDGFWIPAALAGAKDSATVRLEPVAEAPAWQAASYEVFAYSETFEFPSATGDAPAAEPHRFDTYPNPFHQQTTIRYHAPRATDVEVAVYDLLGRRVAVVHDGFVSKGVQHLTWRPPPTLAGGVYVVTWQTDTARRSRMAVLVR